MVDVMKIVNVEHFVFRGVFKPLSYFLCLAYACLLCLAPNLHYTNAHEANTRTSFKMFDGKQGRNIWKGLKMNIG